MENGNVLGNIKVLYVEDETITRSYVCRTLKKSVGKLITASNGEEGINKAKEYRPDIIVTDLVMPDMSGIEMMRKLRQNGYKCPFIITSALSDSGTILETVDLKIEKYIIKPVDPDLLIGSLTQIATEILEKKEEILIVKNNLVLTEDAKNEFEVEIRNIYSKYLKKVIGKGAKLIQVFISGKEIEILFKDTLTVLEENLLATGPHHKSIEMLRKIVYESTRGEVEQQIGDIIERTVKIKQIDIYPREKFERVILQVI